MLESREGREAGDERGGRLVGRPCTICQHPMRSEVDKALAGQWTPAGRIECPPQGYRQVAKHFGIGVEALRRHMKFHTPAGRIQPGKKVTLRSASAFLVAGEKLYSLTSGALTAALEIGDLTAVARLVVAAQGLITTAARLTGELTDAAPQVAISLRWGDDAPQGANGGQPAALPAAHPVVDAEVVKREPA